MNIETKEYKIDYNVFNGYPCVQCSSRTCTSMCSTTILDLPTEIFESVILPYLRDEDILNFGRIGIKRFEDIANGYLKDNKCK